MRLKIKTQKTLVPGQFYWTVDLNGCITSYENPTAAFEGAKKRLKRFIKESSAYSMVQTIAVNMLELKDVEFVNKLRRTKCKGITGPQYGYIKGIHERQKREW